MLLELAGKQERKNKRYAFHRMHLRQIFRNPAQPACDERKLVISRPRGAVDGGVQSNRVRHQHRLNFWDAARKAISPASRAEMQIG